MKLKILRIILAVILLADMIFIFFNSAQNAESSSSTSKDVTQTIAPIIVPEYKNMDNEQKSEVVISLNSVIREAAHLIQFIPLGFSLYLLLCTYSINNKKRSLLFIPITLCGGFLYALSDELHQIPIAGRAFQWFDIGMDMLGVSFGCLIGILILVIAFKHQFKHSAQSINNS